MWIGKQIDERGYQWAMDGNIEFPDMSDDDGNPWPVQTATATNHGIQF